MTTRIRSTVGLKSNPNDVGVPVSRVIEGIDAAEHAGLAPIKVNAVAITNSKRDPLMPELPTVEEAAGLAGAVVGRCGGAARLGSLVELARAFGAACVADGAG